MLVVGAFIADQLSSLVDAHWQVAAFSYRVPWHIGITIFWGAVVVWILHCVWRKDPSTPKTLLYVGWIALIFLVFEVSDPGQSDLAVLVSFQTLEALIWFVCYTMCRSNKTLLAWFAEGDEED